MTDAETANEARNPEGMIFEILKKAADGSAAARLGRLSLPKRNPIETPNYIAVASRGVIPHVTPDNLAKYAPFGAAYMALEDCEHFYSFWSYIYFTRKADKKPPSH